MRPPMENEICSNFGCVHSRVCLWHVAKFFCNAKLGRYRGMADIEEAPPRSIWLKPPTRKILACAVRRRS
jgi:hypothetical protein